MDQSQLEIIKTYSPEDWNTFFEGFAKKRDLQSANWIFKTIGLVSLSDYLSIDVENIFNSYLDPTQANKTKFVLAINRFQDSMNREIGPRKFLLVLAMWIRIRRTEKLLIQFFTHLHSDSDTRNIAIDLHKNLKRNNVYYKSLNRFGNTDYSVDSIQKIIDASPDLPQKSQHLQKFHFAQFQYIHTSTTGLHNLAEFLEETGFILKKESFIYLFISGEFTTSETVVTWKKELLYLCFLFRVLVILKVIQESDASKLWQKIADSFISVSNRKKDPRIKAEILSVTSSNKGLTGLSKENMGDWVKSENNPRITVIHDKLQEYFGDDARS